MSHALPAPAVPASKAAASPPLTLAPWADGMLAILFAALALACAGHSLQMMSEIPADMATVAVPAGAPASADTMTAWPRGPSP